MNAIPEILRGRQQWLVWRLEQRAGDKKPRKVPYYAAGRRRTGEQGSPDDRVALADFDTATAAQRAGKYDGIGFAFLPSDGLIGIDLDGMIDGETGEISERGQAIIEACASYTELSPSGRGVHIIVAGEAETFKSNAVGVEVFCGRQFFTVTGHHYSGTPTEVMPISPEALRRLRATVEQARTSTPKAAATRPAGDLGAKVESALAFVSPDCGYDDWLHVGMAIHAELGDGGFALWDGWSAKSGKYPGERELRTKWKSFQPGGITGGTLYGLATRAGWRAPKLVDTQGPTPSKKPYCGEDPEGWELSIPGGKPRRGFTADLLPSWLGDMARAVAYATETPEDMAVLFCLGMVAICLQGRYVVAPKGDDYIEIVALWIIVAMQSGSRKSAVVNLLKRPLDEWVKQQRSDMLRAVIERGHEIKATDDLIERKRRDLAKLDDPGERRRLLKEIADIEADKPEELHFTELYGTEPTPEALHHKLVEQGERFAVLSAEGGVLSILGGLYSGKGRANIDVVLAGHAGDSVIVHRAGRTPMVIRCAHLSMVLAIQPGILYEVADNPQFRHSGLLARNLIVIPESNIGRRDVRRSSAIDPGVKARYDAGILGLLAGRPTYADEPRRIEFTDPAREAWFDFAEAIERQQGDGQRFESIRDWTGKLPGQVARIAALIELADGGRAGDGVSLQSVERATEIGQRLIDHAMAMFGMIGANERDADALAVLRWIRAEPSRKAFDRTTLYNAHEARFGGNTDRATEAMKRLTEWGVVRHERIKSGTKGGRPRDVYAVNPLVFPAN